MKGPTLAEQMSERQLQDAILAAAHLGGWGAYHTFDSRHSQAGFPDVVLWHPRRRQIIFAELKRQAGRLSLDQADTLDTLREAGADVRVWRPADLESVVTLLLQGRRP